MVFAEEEVQFADPEAFAFETTVPLLLQLPRPVLVARAAFVAVVAVASSSQSR